MQGIFTVTVEFLDGRPSQDIPMPLNFNDGEEQGMSIALIGKINLMGGILEFGSGEVRLLPMTTIKSVTVKAPVLSTATPSDLAAASGGRIKLS